MDTGLPKILLPVNDAERSSPSHAVIKLPQITWRKPSGWNRDDRIGLTRDSPELTALYSVPASGGKAVQLTPKYAEMPCWTPDGKELAYASKGKIFKVSLEDGKIQEVLTGLDATYGDISRSPDGKILAFTATQGGGELEFWLLSDFLPLLQPKR